MAVVRGGARRACTTIAATAGGTVASTGIWAISPGGTGGGWKADGGSGRGAGVPGGNFAVNHSGEKLGRGLIVPHFTGPGQAHVTLESYLGTQQIKLSPFVPLNY